MALDSGLRKYIEKQITEFMNELDDTVQAAIDLNVEHKLDFIFGYLYGTIFALAYDYVNGNNRKKNRELTFEEYGDLYEFISKKKTQITDAMYFRGVK